MGPHPRLSDIEGFLVLITPIAFEVRQVPWNVGGKRSYEWHEVMRCDLVVLDPPTHGARHMAVSAVTVDPANPFVSERSDVVLPARFNDWWVASVGIVTHCRQATTPTTAGRPYRYQRMGGRKAWSIRPVTLSDQAILDRYRREVS